MKELEQLFADLPTNSALNIRILKDSTCILKHREKEELVGVTVYWVNDWHPYSLNFASYFLPKMSNHQIYMEALNDIKQVAVDQNFSCLITREYSPHHNFNQWLLSQGFQCVRQTVEPELRLEDIHLEPNSLKVDYKTFNEVKNDSQLLNKLAKNSFDYYEKSHQINPVGKNVFDDWKMLIQDFAIDDLPILSLKNDEIVSYCFAFEEDASTLSLAWMWGEENYLMDLFSKICSVLPQRFERLTGEFDTTDSCAISFYHSLPFEPTFVYETLKSDIGE